MLRDIIEAIVVGGAFWVAKEERKRPGMRSELGRQRVTVQDDRGNPLNPIGGATGSWCAHYVRLAWVGRS